jgi:aspartate-semialdehyde dehydrogenase
MERTFNVAVIGATGLVGETIVSVLEERGFPVGALHPLASERSIGRSVEFRGRSYPVRELAGFDFTGVDFALFTAGAAVSREHVPRALAAGAFVIDNSSEFRARAEVPLIVPEVNGALLESAPGHLFANPNCSTVQLVMVLKPLHDAAALQRVDVASYQSVSGAGREAIEELARQSVAALSGQGAPELHGGNKPIAFNCIPYIDGFEENGYTREEMKFVRETRKILALPQLAVNATAVRVPVFYGHSEAVRLITERPLSARQARELLENAPGVTVLDERRLGGYPTAATEAANRDTVYVGRIREDLAPDGGLNLWIVADNVRKGAATNTVQIAEALVRRRI